MFPRAKIHSNQIDQIYRKSIGDRSNITFRTCSFSWKIKAFFPRAIKTGAVQRELLIPKRAAVCKSREEEKEKKREREREMGRSKGNGGEPRTETGRLLGQFHLLIHRAFARTVEQRSLIAVLISTDLTQVCARLQRAVLRTAFKPALKRETLVACIPSGFFSEIPFHSPTC